MNNGVQDFFEEYGDVMNVVDSVFSPWDCGLDEHELMEMIKRIHRNSRNDGHRISRILLEAIKEWVIVTQNNKMILNPVHLETRLDKLRHLAHTEGFNAGRGYDALVVESYGSNCDLCGRRTYAGVRYSNKIDMWLCRRCWGVKE